MRWTLYHHCGRKRVKCIPDLKKSPNLYALWDARIKMWFRCKEEKDMDTDSSFVLPSCSFLGEKRRFYSFLLHFKTWPLQQASLGDVIRPSHLPCHDPNPECKDPLFSQPYCYWKERREWANIWVSSWSQHALDDQKVSIIIKLVWHFA